MKPLHVASCLAAALLMAGCGSSSTPGQPAGTSITTFSASDVGQDLINLIPTTFGGVTVDGMPDCDSPLDAIGDVSLCDAKLSHYRGNYDSIEHTISVTLVDRNGHVRVNVQD